MKWLLVFLTVMLMATSVAAQGLFPLSESQCDCGPAGCSQTPMSHGQPLGGSSSGWQGSRSTQQAVPPMVRQYQGLQQVAPRGPSGGFITIGDPATVQLPVSPPVPDPDPRLGLSVRDDVRRQQREIADLKRTKVDGGQILPVQMGTPPGVLTDQQAAGIMGNLDGMSQTVVDLDDRVVVLENALAAARKMIDDVDPDKIKTEIGQQLYDQAQQARTEANAAADKLQAAADGIIPTAKAAAEAAVEKAVEDDSFLNRLVARAGEGIIPGRQLPVVVEAVKNTWTWGAIAGLGGWGLAGVIGIVVITFFVVRRRVPGARELMTQGADQVVNIIPGSLDNMALRLGRRMLAGMESGIDYAEEAVGIPTPAPRKRPTKKGK